MRVLLRGGKGLDYSIGYELDHIDERRGDRYWVKEDSLVPDTTAATGPVPASVSTMVRT